MKIKIAICVLAAAVAAAFLPRSPVAPAQASDARASADIVARIRPLGLSVVGEPVRQGGVYIVNALDPRGAELRVIVDARQGHIVSIGPAPSQNTAYASVPQSYSPHLDASPRIINIAPIDEEDDDDYAAPAPRRMEPRRNPQPRQSRIESRKAEPRIAVRQVTPPVMRPQEPSPRIEFTPNETPAAPQASNDADAIHAMREEIRREFEKNQRASAPPPAQRARPRTVLAPPPYADQALTPVRPLHRRDNDKFAPPADSAAIDEEPTAPLTAAEELRNEARAAVPQVLPQIPPPPRAVGLPAPSAEVAQKPVEVAPAAAENPEDTPPPGTAVGDFPEKTRPQ